MIPQVRWLLVIAVVGSALFLAGLVAAGAFGVGRSVFKPEVGNAAVVTFDRKHTDDGYVSTGVLGGYGVDLVAKDGRIVHSWALNHPLQGMATMDTDGSLVYMGIAPPQDGQPVLPNDFGAAAALERVGWDGHLEWSTNDWRFSHDFIELPDGTLAVLRLSELPTDFAARISGGIPGSELDGQVWGNQIVEIDPATKQERVF